MKQSRPSQPTAPTAPASVPEAATPLDSQLADLCVQATSDRFGGVDTAVEIVIARDGIRSEDGLARASQILDRYSPSTSLNAFLTRYEERLKADIDGVVTLDIVDKFHRKPHQITFTSSAQVSRTAGLLADFYEFRFLKSADAKFVPEAFNYRNLQFATALEGGFGQSPAFIASESHPPGRLLSRVGGLTPELEQAMLRYVRTLNVALERQAFVLPLLPQLEAVERCQIEACEFLTAHRDQLHKPEKVLAERVQLFSSMALLTSAWLRPFREPDIQRSEFEGQGSLSVLIAAALNYERTRRFGLRLEVDAGPEFVASGRRSMEFAIRTYQNDLAPVLASVPSDYGDGSFAGFAKAIYDRYLAADGKLPLPKLNVFPDVSTLRAEF